MPKLFCYGPPMNTKLNEKRPPKPLAFLLAAALLAAGAFGAYKYFFDSGPKGPPPVKPLTVKAAKTRLNTTPVYIHALGNVTPPRTVTVRSRVDGELIAVHFVEGRRVREGDLLAEIDPRPFEVQKAQALGTLARDEALLKDALLDLERYRRLIKERSVSQQQLQSQEALVGQYEGAVTSDKAAVADAELQLTYSRITAPVSGRVGLRRVDIGNIVRSSDSDGIVVITQMQPMEVVFTLVEKQIPDVIAGMRKGRLEVEAWGQDNTKLLAKGVLKSLDNQIDMATGTVKAKAEFDNADEALFPNQFVNVRLRVAELENVLTVPTSAVQRNISGFFVYVVEDGKTRMQEIKSSYATDLITVVDEGLKLGDVVVTDGVDRLRQGSRVTVWTPQANAAAAESADDDAFPGAGREKAGGQEAAGERPGKGAPVGRGKGAGQPAAPLTTPPQDAAVQPPGRQGTAPESPVPDSPAPDSPAKDGYAPRSAPGLPGAPSLGLPAPGQEGEKPAAPGTDGKTSDAAARPPALRCSQQGPDRAYALTPHADQGAAAPDL